MRSLLAEPELFENGAKSRLLPRLDLAAPGENMGDLGDRRNDRAAGIHLAEHPAVVGGIAEQLRLERDYGHRRNAKRLDEILDRDFGALRHARLVEDQLGRRI